MDRRENGGEDAEEVRPALEMWWGGVDEVEGEDEEECGVDYAGSSDCEGGFEGGGVGGFGGGGRGGGCAGEEDEEEDESVLVSNIQ